MGTKLFIAEKPSLGRAIAEVIGIKAKRDGYIECKNGAVVTWCFGHILELAKPEEYTKNKKWSLSELPIIPDRWKKVVKKDARKQFNTIKKLIQNADVIINAGDPDREGQLLVDEVLDYLRVKKPVKRIWLQALDRENIIKALKKIEDNKKFLPYKLSAEARSYADWLVGMNFTRYFTLREGKLITVGRVQTPTLALVVKRDEEIESFKPHDYYVLTANFDGFKAVFKPGETQQGLDSQKRLIDRNIALGIARKTSGKQARVIAFSRKKRIEYPPLPYMLSTLQKAMNEKFGLTAKQTLAIAQTLYEKKLTTYPRTDCPYIAEEQHRDARKILTAVGKLGVLPEGTVNNAILSVKHRAFDNSKLGAHTAIIPTGDTSSFNTLSEKEKKVYIEIARAYACLFHKPHEYYSISAEFDINGYKFTANGKQTIEWGFRKYCPSKTKDTSIPLLKTGQTVLNKETTIETKKTTPPPRFTDGTLIDAMSHIHRYIDNPQAKKILKENDGIGTEATRAQIIDQLVKRGYLKRVKRQIISTPQAREFIKKLPSYIKDPVMTAEWERELSRIVQGKTTLKQFLNMQIEFVKQKIKKVS